MTARDHGPPPTPWAIYMMTVLLIVMTIGWLLVDA